MTITMNKKRWISIAIIAILFPAILIAYNSQSISNTLGNAQEAVFGEAYPNAKWVMIKDFVGWQTDKDPSKIADGANAQGQNTSVNSGDRISVRQLGYELFPTGTASTTEYPIKSIHTFRKRSGENIMMRTYSTFIEYYEEGNDSWTILKTGLVDGDNFAFADYNINTDLHSYTYFGSANNDAMRWNGAHTTLTTAATSGATVLFVDDTSDFIYSTSTIILCGTEVNYNSKTATTFTLASGAPACTDDSGVANYVEYNSQAPKGNIYLVANNRLFIAGIASTSQAIYFSGYGNAITFTGATLVADGTDASPGIFNLGEGGGAVTGLALAFDNIYAFKKSIIYKITLSDTIYTLEPLKNFDGKSQTTGLKSARGTFTNGNVTYFITPDNQIMELGRVEYVEEPQIKSISENIQQTVDDMNFDEAVGIVFRDKAYFSAKSNTSVGFNDTVLVWNIKDKLWDSPIVGWNVQDFVVYDNGTTEDLYFGHAVNPNIYKVNEIPLDDIYSVKANWRSKQFDFGVPESLKTVSDFYVEGYITSNTDLTISMLLDENGYTQTISTTFKGTESAYLYSGDSYNVFGFSSFGTERFGSNDDLTDKNKFRIYLNKDFRPLPFYNMQVEFASDQENGNWEVTAFGMKVQELPQGEKRELIRAFK